MWEPSYLHLLLENTSAFGLILEVLFWFYMYLYMDKTDTISVAT